MKIQKISTTTQSACLLAEISHEWTLAAMFFFPLRAILQENRNMFFMFDIQIFCWKRHLSDGLEHLDNLQIKSSWFLIVSESDVCRCYYIHYMICRPGFSSGPGSKSAGSPSALFWILCWPVFVLSLEVLVLIWDATLLFMLSFGALWLPSWVCTSRTLVW